MSISKSLMVGVVVGLVIGIALGYVFQPKVDLTLFQQKIDDLESQIASLQGQLEDAIGLGLASESVPQPQPSAVRMFLWIEGVPGESIDEGHKDWIELLSYGHTVSASLLPLEGRADHGDFSITKAVDKASPKLYLFVNTGERIQEVRVEVTRNGAAFMVYKLEDVLISSVHALPMEEVSLSSPLPLEEVSFNYGRVKWEYTTFDETGAPLEKIVTGWDLAENKAT